VMSNLFSHLHAPDNGAAKPYSLDIDMVVETTLSSIDSVSQITNRRSATSEECRSMNGQRFIITKEKRV
jgi:hypothetical protein